MALSYDYLKGLQKNQGASSSGKTTSNKGDGLSYEYLKGVQQNRSQNLAQMQNLAPIKTITTTKKKKKKDEDERTWFKSGLFKDGYDFGDISKTILGSGTDIVEDLSTGIVGMGEKAWDGLLMLGTAMNNQQMNQSAQNQMVYNAVTGKETDGILERSLADQRQIEKETAEYVKKDLYDEEKIAKKIITNPVEKVSGINVEDTSVFGAKSDSLIQSGGQLLGTAGLQMAGVPWFLTTGATAYGSQAEQSLREGATFQEANASALISAGAEILTEKLSGGIKFGGKTLDDVLVKSLTEKISGKTLKTLANLGLDAVGEGSEEVVSSVLSNLGTALYKEDKVSDILFSEEAVDEYIESFIGGSVLGGVSSGFRAIRNGVKETYTENEQKVIDKEVENRIAESEQDGNTLTKKDKNKIREEVLRDLDKGYISIDTIESVLGGETYDNYKSTVDREDALLKEFEELGERTNATLKEQARYKELEGLYNELKNSSQRSQLKSQLSDEVYNLAKNSRLAESYNERARLSEDFQADFSKFKGVKHEDAAKKTLENAIKVGANNTNRIRDLVEMNARVSGDLGIVFEYKSNEQIKNDFIERQTKEISKIESIPEAQRTEEQNNLLTELKDTLEKVKSGKVTVNGDITADSIVINLDSAKALNRLTGHEITHSLEKAKNYNELRDHLFAYAKAKGVDIDSELAILKSKYQGIVNANPEAELVADLVGDYLFTDADFINSLSTEKPNVFKRIYNEIKYLCKIATAGSKEARELEKVKRAFDKAYKESANKTNDDTEVTTEDTHEVNTKYSLVTDEDTIAFLENQDYVVTYKAMQVIDGKLYPPMSAEHKVEEEYTNKKGEKKVRTVKKLKQPSELGKWQQSEENVELAKQSYDAKKGYSSFELLKGDGKSLKGVAYNPYEHTSNIVLNDQFSSAHRRDNLVTVEYHIPVSELTSGYKAEYAKDAVGKRDWHTGLVASNLKNSHRDVYLTRWSKPVRVLSDSEVAQKYKEILDKEDGVTVPWNVVTQSLREELEKVGVPIDYSDKKIGTSTFNFEASLRGEYLEQKKNSKSKAKNKTATKYSLTEGQETYFKDSKVRDENGNLKVMYHGTSKGGHTVFDTYGSNYGLFGQGSYFTDNKSVAESYTNKGKGNNKQVYESYLNITNPLDMDAQGNINEWQKAFPEADFSNCNTNEEFYRAVEEYYSDQMMPKWEVAETIKDSIQFNMGYDGITHIGGGRFNKKDDTRHQVYIAFEPEQIKNIDNIAPTKDADIRYSISEDSEGNKLTEKQSEYFKDSKAVDRNGNLLKVYHTTKNDFTVFDKSKKGEATEDANTYLGFFFTDDAEYMQNFPEFENGKTESYYLNMKNPIDMTDISREAFMDIVEVMGGDVGDASILFDEELEDAHKRAKLRGDNNVSLQLGHLLDELTGEFYYDDFIRELQPHYDELMSKGYDGVINYMDELFGVKEYVVLDSHQAKLTSNTNPTEDADVRYSLTEQETQETNEKLNKVGFNYDAKSGTIYSLSSLEDAFNYKTDKNGFLVTENDYLKARNEYVDALAKSIAEEKGKPTREEYKKADRYLDSLFLVHDMIAKDKDRLDYEAAVNRSAWVGNVEYGGSIDFSTLCAKRRLFTGTFDAIQNALPDTVLTDKDFLNIRKLLLEHGEESPCSMCYVEGSRAKHGVYVDKWLKEYLKTNPEWKPQIADFTSTTRLEQTRIQHPEAYAEYVKAMNKLSQRKPKEASVRTDYKGEILDAFSNGSSVEEKNKNGGIRFNSFSDFEIIHALDCMQVLTDMARVGLNGQSYTKVKEFAESFGNTGLKINLSLVAKDVDANGKLVMDETNGMNYAEAMDIRNRYSDNVGTVIVVFNDEQLRAALADNTIDFVLPFHRSQWRKSQYALMGLPEVTRDYTNIQNDRYKNPKTGRPKKAPNGNIMPNEYWDFSLDGRENAQRYLDYINENSYIPKFDFLLDNVDGKWVLPEGAVGDGYFKLLIDFKMYNNEGVGSPQKPVLPEFNMPYIQQMLSNYVGGHQAFPVAHDVVSKFVEGKKKGTYSLSEEGETFRENGNFDVYGKDFKVQDDIAPTVSKMEQVAPLGVAKNTTTTLEDIAPMQEPVEDIVPTKEYEAIEPMPEKQPKMVRADNVDDDTEGAKPLKRSELHNNIVEGIKTKFAEKGLDFDKILSKAKNLSTFATVDNTPQRVMEKALGYKEGQVLADETVNKVAQNETEGIKWLNSFTDRKNGVLAQLSKQYNIKPGSKKSAVAQMYAEGFYVNENNEIIEYGDKELAKDFPNPKDREDIKGLANDPRIRQIYDETLSAINESRSRNAYPEIQRLDNYFLHFRAMEDTFSRLGLPFNPNDIRAKDLPTDLNGVTADLKPGQPYFASAMHRTGMRTSFDLLGGLERYLSSAKNQIYHIDDIQTLRALRNYIADTYGQAKGLESLDNLAEEEIQERIKQVYGSHLSTFAKFLNEEANVLAGKTTLIDRGLEGIIGRRGITFLDTVNKQVGSNMVGFNVSSSLTNILPVVQTFAKTNKFDFVKALAQTTSDRLNSLVGKSDGFKENSPVIIRRKGADRFYRTPFQKVGDTGYILMSAVDDISTEIIARTKYNEFTRKGMDSQQAHFETDKWVSRLMGDRSLGQQPQIFNSKMLGMVTKFQLEVRNQLDSQFYDTIQEAKVSNEEIEDALLRNAKTSAKVVSTFFQLAVMQHLFGKAFESVAGYNPAFDIIEALIKTFGLDDDEDDEDTVLNNIEEGFLTLLDDLPYASTFTGGRIPISAALPIKELVKGEDDYGNEVSRWGTIKETAPYYLLPTGYGQVKKTIQGLKMFDDDLPIAGSYTDSGNLRFPVEDNLKNRVQAGVFGQWANENARAYFDNDIAPLKEKQIKEYADVDMPIKDYWKYREGLKNFNKQDEKVAYINGLDVSEEQKNVLKSYLYDEEGYKEKNPEKYAFLESEGIGFLGYKELDEETQSSWSWAFKHQDEYRHLKENGVYPEDYSVYYVPMQEFDDEGDEAYTWAFDNPEKATLGKVFSNGVKEYKQYTSDLYNIRADKKANGKTISGSAKRKKKEYIWNLDIDDGAKYILFKSEYNADDTYNDDIVDYLNNRDDISSEDMITILQELGATVDAEGYIYW